MLPHFAINRIAKEFSAVKARFVVLALLTLMAGWLRFTATSFGLPDKYRPDEEYLLSRALGFQKDWNPNFAIYPAAQMYVNHAALRLYAVVAGKEFNAAFSDDDGSRAYLIVRRVSAAFGTATVPAIYFAAAPAFGTEAALSAAAILAVSTLHMREAKYATTDAAMIFWVTMAIAMVLRIVHSGRYRDYVGAGFFAGLATATKYPAGAIVFGIVAAHLGARHREGRSLLRSYRDLRIYLAGCITIVTFVCTTPYLVFDWRQTVNDFVYQRGFVLYGLPNPQAGYGWSWLLLRAMPDSMGIAMQTVLLGSMLWALIRPRPGTLSLLAFIGVAVLGITGSRYVFYRYLVVLLPAMAILGGIVAAQAGSTLSARFGEKTATAVFGLGLGLLLLPSLIRDVELNRLLSRPDTRTLARQWIKGHIPPSSVIAVTNRNYLYGKPQLSSAYSLVELDDLAGLRRRNVRWVLSDSFAPISFYSRGPSDAELAALNSQGTLVFDVDSVKRGAPAPIVDPQDAYYAPIGNITSMERPGPRIRIWELK